MHIFIIFMANVCVCVYASEGACAYVYASDGVFQCLAFVKSFEKTLTTYNNRKMLFTSIQINSLCAIGRLLFHYYYCGCFIMSRR